MYSNFGGVLRPRRRTVEKLLQPVLLPQRIGTGADVGTFKVLNPKISNKELLQLEPGTALNLV